MSAIRIDGKTLSAELREKLKERVNALKARGITPGLAVILVGEDEASKIYVRNKENGCEEIGVKSFSYRLPETATQSELEELIKKLNKDENVNGILVQLPLPNGLDEQKALALIDAKKDVDGFHIENMGKLLIGTEGVVACTPKGAMYMIRSTGIDLSGKHAVVIGRSNIVGKPMSVLLLGANCTVTMCHSRTQNLKEFTKTADILVAAVGKAKFITADMVKPGAVVIDVGINRVDGKVVGDVDYDSVSEVAGYITPVPGGVGKMTITMLLDNTVEAAERYA
ncbi:MAG: bifunctional methylenetetrahydrofolate dehydrogenase/methenyltetrahydrofolate cyclohydrolase FolD [Eubacteriales bacterium]|nr:bifunctional methylenetetrahydrofolate dehydrogenase/methenyltetrahydrofolate cyclohydrolase FolD [Eubacteriales bacterium]MDD3882234.1 bifunctional methylenetetrahydrofolate dehydrogenase/methenyltetrahydrofolate cyclohydrolase FolD [Eubacteriales bacterium]MDD4512583.1 bifunctional methylenetetrahydrofolate dehydrogenase/methenyltetrahydrofolate cyclohydrolase FolD [Eubacteriales bacterium]